MKPTPRLLVPALALLTVAAAGAGYYAYTHQAPQPGPTLAAGLPLPPVSGSDIKVLPAANGKVQDGLGQTVTASNQALPSTASITLPQVAAPQPSPQPKQAVFDPTAARLGTTLSLLLNAWPNGGPLPRQLATAAAELAEKTGQPALANAAAALRSSTPREGPMTLQVLLLEASHVVDLTPPENLPQTDAQAEAEKSWFRKQLEKLVTISDAPATQNRWVVSIMAVQQQLVRGAVTDAMASLESSPLENDERLEPLRRQIRDYLGQSGKLTNLVTTYTNTYLLNQDD